MIRALRHRLVRRLAACLLAGAVVPGSGAASDGQPAADPENPATAVVKSALPQELISLMPFGRKFKGIAIPTYAGDRLKSVMTADSITRVDERHLDLVNLVVQVYNSSGDPETTISMDEAAYDLVAGELASKTPSTIRQPRFTMTGDKMTFETVNQVARLTGNVHLVVPDAGRLTSGFNLPGTAPTKTDTP